MIRRGACKVLDIVAHDATFLIASIVAIGCALASLPWPTFWAFAAFCTSLLCKAISVLVNGD